MKQKCEKCRGIGSIVILPYYGLKLRCKTCKGTGRVKKVVKSDNSPTKE